MGKETALPKNIRQIGEVQGKEKICLEDYVMTYIHKKEKQEEKGCLGVFLGEQQECGDSAYVFIRGILEIPQNTDGESTQEENLREFLAQERQKYFPEWEIQGCCVIGAYPTERMKTLANTVPESGKLIYHLQEQEESLYWTDENQYRRIRGYFVFYEQNRKMQEYLAEIFKDDSVEKESLPDKAIKSFREKVKEKGEKRRSASFLRMASSFFVITVLVIGAIVVNRVEDIRSARNVANLTDNAVENEAQNQADSQTKSNVVSIVAGTVEETGLQNSTLPGAAEETGSTASAGSVSGNAAQTSAEASAGDLAEEDIVLAGSNAFWEDTVSDTEDAAGGVNLAAAYDTLQDGAAADMSGAEEASAAGQSQAEEASAAGQSGAEEAGAAGQSGAADGQVQTAAENPAQEAAVRQTQASYVIKEGDTLANICSRYYGNTDKLEELCAENNITDANMILPGQKIVLP